MNFGKSNPNRRAFIFPNMRSSKNQSKLQVQPEITQTKQSNKKCTCGAASSKPKLPAAMRRIKIQQKFVAQVRSHSTVPVIMLTGKWLEKLGFDYDNHVIVMEKKGQLILILKPD